MEDLELYQSDLDLRGAGTIGGRVILVLSALVSAIAVVQLTGAPASSLNPQILGGAILALGQCELLAAQPTVQLLRLALSTMLVAPRPSRLLGMGGAAGPRPITVAELTDWVKVNGLLDEMAAEILRQKNAMRAAVVAARKAAR